MHKIFGTGTTIVQVLPRLQGFALYTTDQVIFGERPTLPQHNTTYNAASVTFIMSVSCFLSHICMAINKYLYAIQPH
jgi:hypothetical protein